jgi:hypothetical protein
LICCVFISIHCKIFSNVCVSSSLTNE